MKKRAFFFVAAMALAVGSCGDDSNENNEKDTGDSDTGSVGGDDTETETEEPADAVYTIMVNGKRVHVTRVSKFETPVNYVELTHDGADLNVEITPKTDFSEYQISPKSKGIVGTVSDGTLSFTVNEPAYLVVQIPDHERLFLLVDAKEEDAPSLDDANVKNVMDYEGVDNTGETTITEILQGAIDDASGAEKNILYFPKGRYSTDSLYLKDNMTMYLAKGAILLDSTPGGNLMSPNFPGLTTVESCARGFIVMANVTNANLMGRGTLDGDGVTHQASEKKMYLLKIDNSKDCVVDGIISRDSVFWNTLIYRSENITIKNYKVINNLRSDNYNETDGVDFNNCVNSSLYNAFLYTGDDCMAVKADDIEDDLDIAGIGDPTEGLEYMNVDNISHEKIVCFSRSSGTKVGTKTFGKTMSNISFRDVDVVQAMRGMVIDAVDTATITGTVFEDIRIENIIDPGRLVDFNMDPVAIFWRKTVGRCTVDNTTVKNETADVSKQCRLEGFKNSDDEVFYVNNTSFINFSVEGNVITSAEDELFSVNEYVGDITFE